MGGLLVNSRLNASPFRFSIEPRKMPDMRIIPRSDKNESSAKKAGLSICLLAAIVCLLAPVMVMATELELPEAITTFPDGRKPVEELYGAYTSLLEKGWQLDIIIQSQPQGREYALPIIALRTPHSGKACWILSGIHGEEPAGPNAIAPRLTRLPPWASASRWCCCH